MLATKDPAKRLAVRNHGSKFASLNPAMIKRVRTRIIGPEGEVLDVWGFVPGT